MYLPTENRLGQPSGPPCPPDLSSSTTIGGRFQRIRRAIECELRLKFTTPTDPGLFVRRQRLRGLFEAVPLGLASTLQRELEEATSELSRLFYRALATPTRRELLARLCRGFFKEYELRFNPMPDTFSVDTNTAILVAHKNRRKQDVIELIGDAVNSPGILWRRLLARVDAALDAGVVPSSLPPLPPTLRGSVERLSKAQLELFREAFPNGQGGIDVRSFQRCFERFANGELRDPSVPGHVGFAEPNGGNYFLFAEFAFLCIDLSLEAAAWSEALKTFVKTQEIFMHVYREHPRSPPPAVGAAVPSGPEARDVLPLSAPGPGFDFTHFKAIGKSVNLGEGQSDLQRKVALRASYDAMDVSRLKVAARDNLLRAVRMR